jgi:hypothetical protein
MQSFPQKENFHKRMGCFQAQFVKMAYFARCFELIFID